jgi:hypothetical protein
MKIAVFDVETDKLLCANKGGSGSTGHEDLKITVACGASLREALPELVQRTSGGALLLSSQSEQSPRKHVRTFYGDPVDALELGGETMEDMGRMLDEADVVVAYNGRSFDIRVLRNHFEQASVDQWEQKLVDPFEAMKDYTGSWVKLDELLDANGLPRKSADGVSAVLWWSEGRKREVAEYCKDDVSGLISLLNLRKFAFPVKRWRRPRDAATSSLKMRQEISGWSELNWTEYLRTTVAKKGIVVQETSHEEDAKVSGV